MSLDLNISPTFFLKPKPQYCQSFSAFALRTLPTLRTFCDKNELPHVVVETHYVLSSDMLHDSAFVQKAFDDHVFPYVKNR